MNTFPSHVRDLYEWAKRYRKPTVDINQAVKMVFGLSHEQFKKEISDATINYYLYRGKIPTNELLMFIQIFGKNTQAPQINKIKAQALHVLKAQPNLDAFQINENQISLK